MAPKRKATTSAAENEPPQTRRRTRSTVATGLAEEPVVKPPPAPRRTRQRTKTDDEPPQAEKPQRLAHKASAPSSSRATRAATRGRKADIVKDSSEQPETVPTRRGRGRKMQPEEDVEEPEEPAHAALSPVPLSPIQEKTAPTIPKKRGRTKQAQAVAQSEPNQASEETRPKRTRRAKTAVVDEKVADALDADSLPLDENANQHAEEAPPSPPKRRGRPKAVPVVAVKVGPPRRAPPIKKLPSPVPPGDSSESSDDELLLSPSKRPLSARPTTPIRAASNRLGTPTSRLVMHSVEITTPRHLKSIVRRDLGSPVPREVVHLPPLGTPRLPPAFPSLPSSPQKREVSAAPGPSSRRSRARTPSPAPTAPSAPESSRSTRRPSPSKRNRTSKPSGDGSGLADHLRPILQRQRRAILQALQRPPEIDEIEVYGEDYPPTNTAAYEQLSDLLAGTVVRGEGNSCMLIGPSGSGKTQMVERAIAALPSNPIVVRLSGYAQHNDRLAIREIAWQLTQQTGTSFLPSDPDDVDADADETGGNAGPAQKEADGDANAVEDEDENPFVEPAAATTKTGMAEVVVALPPPSHLLALISMIPTLPRPTIIVLDGFDLFAGHARQALLYCLLDTAQACRTGTGAGSGMAVVGVTARVDTINLLEKRVKSRFSGRMIRTACPTKVEHWVTLAKVVLGASVDPEGAREDEDEKEWKEIWEKAVDGFVEDERVVDVLRETYALTRDFQMFRRIMTSLTLELQESSPFPTLAKLKTAVSKQRCPPRYPALHTLPYPAVCLLIASVHAQTSGHDVFTFEMLHEAFKTQVRTSQSAPVQVQGGGVGMVRCGREVLFSAFERLVDVRIFVPAAAPGASISKEFALHRSSVDRFAVKKAVETIGQLSLKKWFTKA